MLRLMPENDRVALALLTVTNAITGALIGSAVVRERKALAVMIGLALGAGVTVAASAIAGRSEAKSTSTPAVE